MSDEKPTNAFNITNNVTGAQQQNVGQSGGEATMNVSQEQPLTVETFLNSIAASVPDDIKTEVIEPLRSLASKPGQTEEDKSKIDGLITRLSPHSQAIWDGLKVFGAAALKQFTNTNPIAAGIVALCQPASAQGDKDTEPTQSA